MSNLPNHWARLVGVGLVVLFADSSAFADPDAPRLPRPRPAAETSAATQSRIAPNQARAATTAWSKKVESRFRAARAELDVVPVVEQDIAAGAPDTVSAVKHLARIPRARPEAPKRRSLMALAPATQPTSETLSRRVEPEPTACLARLRALGVAFTKEAPIEDGACLVQHPLRVTALGSGVAITPEAVLNCRTAEALARWTREMLIPLADAFLHATPTKILHGSTYVCRTRNNQPGAKMSEHASANAVDISAIAFAEREPLTVKGRDMSSAEGRFQVAIRGGSCDHFTTVLGPRSNAAHATHFHFDLAERRGGYRLCDLAETNFAGGDEP